MKPDRPYQALLLQPPPGDLTGPYPALCYLKSYAAERGYGVKVKDLGIEALHYLSHPERVTEILDHARQQCQRLEASPILDAGQQRRYGLLLGALSIRHQPDWYANSFYDHNPLKTPEPVWWSDTRMSPQSVNRLYARLNQLEEIYAIDEYPYVGGLSTNHGFLYYTLGPDILKRLRRDEKNGHS